MLAPEGGRVLFVAGQIGVEGGTALAAQFQAALANVAAVVEEAGGTVADVGRLTIYVTDMEAYRGSLPEVGAAYRAVFGKHFPAMALVAVTELVDPRAVVEVEATAVILRRALPARRLAALGARAALSTDR
ncbi:MAG: RidA family protein [Gemmatimonadetes bacterium]|nr:RidA family protein [Gemmatimonadota bacterium]